ncbi:L-lactate permease [Glaciibacter flavus]|uniref:L-lactate permease n=1 Tax=Orlajensenia flava TaxID=2565934 RepID=A0A4S4FG25_9MICO|nr:L-lactate permease [Glaciibacter flavus]THG29133.1 L-lactate permease [Glaciibacter flavus]
MWTQDYDPLGALWLSAIVAAVPILAFLVCLTVFKMKGTTAGIIAVALAVVVALWPFGMPITAIGGSALIGILTGLWPIAFIIVMAVWLYKLAVASGRFDVIRSSIAGISPDQRIQVLLISFSFGAFLEGAAGFGVPIAICAALLVQLGFKPIKAAMISLVANAAAGAYGAIGIPVIVGAKVGGVDLRALSVEMVVVVQLLTFAIPFLLVIILDGWRGLRETWVATLALSIVYSGSQALILLLLGPELADILPGLLGMVALFVVGRFWQPKRIFREDGSVAPEPERHSLREIAAAWSPFYILTAFIFVWSIPWFKDLFAPASADGKTAAGPLGVLVFNVPIPGLNGVVQPPGDGAAPVSAIWQFTPVNATGTAILLSVLVSFFTTPALNWGDLGREFVATVRELWRPIVLILLILVVANITNYSGGSASIGLALAGAGAVFPLFSPIIGWFGVFITGSVVNNNTLFAHLQNVTATKIGVDPTLLVAANTAGGAMGKVVSPQSIAISAAAVGLVGREGEILRASIKYSLGMLAFLCVWVMLVSLVA